MTNEPDRHAELRRVLVDAGVPIDRADAAAGVLATEAAGPAQLSRADLKTMTPEQIVEAKAKGQLVDLLGHPTRAQS